MMIGNVQCGNRIGLGVLDEEQSRFSMGVSMAGDVTTDDYTAPYTDVVLTFPIMNETAKNALKFYLNSQVLQGGIVTVTPAPNDDLQVQRNIATPFIFKNMKAIRISAVAWRTEIYLRFIGASLGSMFVLSGEDIVKM